MGFTRSLAALAAAAALLVPAQAQTYTSCNPLKKTCPPDKALGTSTDIDFTAGEPSDFTTSGTVTYGSDGAELSVTEDNKGPFMQSNWYMMFGRVDVTMKAAPGGGVVSSFILQSDDLDEIDLEWVGTQTTSFQTNFFGKGFTGTFNRGENFETVDAAADFHKYSIDWNSDRIQWIVDGEVLRTLTPSDFPGQYPQSPMFVKFGPWAAGDPTNNPEGVITWSDGPIDWSAAPYTMYVKDITAQDYSTGTQYVYTDRTGTWQSIEAVDGEIDGDATDSSGWTSTTSSASPKPTKTTSSTSSKPTTMKTTTSSKSTLTPSTTKSSTKSSTTSSKSSSETDEPTRTGTSSDNTPTPAAPGDGDSSSTSRPTGGADQQTGGAPTPTGNDEPDATNPPDNAATTGKQAAWGLSLACAFAGLVAAF